MIRTILIFLFLITCVVHVSAQEVAVNRTDSIAKIEGEEYLVHEVLSQQTLFSIAKVYGVKLSRIAFDNPGVLDGLKLGQYVLILKTALDETANQEVSTELQLDGRHVLYQVPAKKTLYAISKEYNTTIASILDANPELSDGLKVGSTIRIPVPKLLVSDVKMEMVGLPNMVKLLPSMAQKEMEVVLILPFYLDKNDTIEAHRLVEEKEEIFSQSEMALQFYEGFLLAVDSLASAGYKVNIKVLDTEKRPWKVQQMIKKGVLNNADLIIGPFYSKVFKEVAAFGYQNCIPVVSSTIQGNSIIAANPYVFKIIPSEQSMAHGLGRFVANSDSTNNMILHYGNADEQALIWRFRQGLETGEGLVPRFPAYNVSITGKDSVLMHLSSAQRNNVVILSNDQVKLASLVRKLSGWLEDTYTVVYAPNAWTRFRSLDIDLYDKLRIHIPMPFFINYEELEVQYFVRKFREKFKGEPNTFAFRGYDIGMHFIQNLEGVLSNGPDYMLTVTETGLQSNFSWNRKGESGYENMAAKIIDHTNLNLKLATD